MVNRFADWKIAANTQPVAAANSSEGIAGTFLIAVTSTTTGGIRSQGEILKLSASAPLIIVIFSKLAEEESNPRPIKR